MDGTIKALDLVSSGMTDLQVTRAGGEEQQGGPGLPCLGGSQLGRKPKEGRTVGFFAQKHPNSQKYK